MKGGGSINKWVRLISVGLVVVMLSAIWQFSAQSAVESSNLSHGLAQWLLGIPGGHRLATISNLDHILRKLAHFGVYTLLGVGLSGTVINREARLVIGIALPFGAVLAILDEWHQSFVPGRGPGWSDVLLDTCGVLTGILLMLMLRWTYRRIRNR